MSPWFRSLFLLRPDPALMTGAPLLFQLHAISALLLFAAWPFTRLVHMLTAPIGHLTRPCIVYRSRDVRLGIRAPRRGRERTGSQAGGPVQGGGVVVVPACDHSRLLCSLHAGGRSKGAVPPTVCASGPRMSKPKRWVARESVARGRSDPLCHAPA
ncbi:MULTISPECIES: respiratory nitrate reductase subunit gamma [Streptomyces]|uniref:respiratory nitrate reductase subunit gamma n=1 Tax=Streptomyces TaxID=1883 RepID=UPI0038023A20